MPQPERRKYAAGRVLREGLVTLVLRGEEFPVHADVLYSASKVVRGLLEDVMRDNKEAITLPESLCPEALDAFLCDAYGDASNGFTSGYTSLKEGWLDPWENRGRVLDFFDPPASTHVQFDISMANMLYGHIPDRGWSYCLSPHYSVGRVHNAHRIPEALVFLQDHRERFPKSFTAAIVATIACMAVGASNKTTVFWGLPILEKLHPPTLIMLAHTYDVISLRALEHALWKPKTLAGHRDYGLRVAHLARRYVTPGFLVGRGKKRDTALELVFANDAWVYGTTESKYVVQVTRNVQGTLTLRVSANDTLCPLPVYDNAEYRCTVRITSSLATETEHHDVVDTMPVTLGYEVRKGDLVRAIEVDLEYEYMTPTFADAPFPS